MTGNPVPGRFADQVVLVTGEAVLVDGGRSQAMQDDASPDYRRRREER